MIPHKLSSLTVLVAIFVVLAPLASGDVLWLECTKDWNYTQNSTYQSNLRQLSATLPAKAASSPTHLFATGTAGAVPDAVHALALCRGDAASASFCAACVANAFQDAQQMCAYNMEAVVYYEPCFLRFSNQNFLNLSSDNKQHIMPNGEDAALPKAGFDAAVGALLAAVVDYAARRSPSRFGTGVKEYYDDGGSGNATSIYAMAQCTPDQSPDDCRTCLEKIVKVQTKFFSGKQGGRILGLYCNYRFELYPFAGTPLLRLQAAPAPAPTPDIASAPAGTPYDETREARIKPSTILTIALGTVSSALAITLVCHCVWSRRKSQGVVLPYSSNKESIQNMNLSPLDLSILKAATENFAESNKLGEGGFGAVYKGELPDGQQIAVKRLAKGSRQGIGELKNELILVAKLHHRNIVRLIGVCLEEQEKLIVYEYMPNRSLDTILFDPEKSKDLDWGKRFEIICGIARGLQYVHEDSQFKIIHRDLKTNNVLLDTDLNPKISDFGLARLFEGDKTKDVTKRVVGTLGYMPPEYVMRGLYSIKLDVFSFGVLVLEIVTGRRNGGPHISEQSVNLLTLIWEHWTNGRILEVVDPVLISFPEDQALACVHVALLCVQERPTDRPTMSAVNLILSTIAPSLPTPSRPAFCFQASSNDPGPHHGASNTSATRIAADVTPNEMSITDLEAR